MADAGFQDLLVPTEVDGRRAEARAGSRDCSNARS